MKITRYSFHMDLILHKRHVLLLLLFQHFVIYMNLKILFLKFFPVLLLLLIIFFFHQLQIPYYMIFENLVNLKTRTMTADLHQKLQNDLRNGSLIYDMEKMPTYEYESSKDINDLPDWRLSDSIEKLKKYKGVKNDNGGHFFEYLAVECL